jgi:hypothetical protein
LMSVYLSKDLMNNNSYKTKKLDRHLRSFVVFQTILSVCFMFVLYLEYGKSINLGIALVVFVFQIFALLGLAKIVDSGKINLNIEIFKLFASLLILFWVKNFYVLWFCILLLLASTFTLAKFFMIHKHQNQNLPSKSG